MRYTALITSTLLIASAAVLCAPSAPPRLDGFNIVAVREHPFGGPAAERAIAQAKRLGATTLAIIPFLWQATPSSPTIVRGNDMSDSELRAAIRQTRAHGLRAIVKPHVWVPTSWAGTVEPGQDRDWQTWFAGYEQAMLHLASIAAQERAFAFVIGTELTRTTQRPEWNALIGKFRAVFPGLLFYVAHDMATAEQVPFWTQLDAIGISLYPPLGDDNDLIGRELALRAIADRLDTLSRRVSKPVIVAEVGLRSAQGAAAKPWESAEERDAAPNPALQADILAAWLRVLDRPSVTGVLIWRWLSDPAAGGANDTDFTVQGKPAEAVLRCHWRGACGDTPRPSIR